MCSGCAVFARAIHSLAKIGDFVLVEPNQSGLSLQVVSSSHSAFACFKFLPLFFSSYQVKPVRPDDTTSCRLSMKVNPSCFILWDERSPLKKVFIKIIWKLWLQSLLLVFRSVSLLERSAEQCEVTVDVAQLKVTFQLHCRFGVDKMYRISFVDSEPMEVLQLFMQLKRGHTRGIQKVSSISHLLYTYDLGSIWLLNLIPLLCWNISSFSLSSSLCLLHKSVCLLSHTSWGWWPWECSLSPSISPWYFCFSKGYRQYWKLF